MVSAPPISDRLSARVVFFGPPFSGKSSLLQAFVRAAAPDGVGTTVPSTGGIRGELVPHIVRLHDARSRLGEAVVVYDCDGNSAGELLSHPDALVRGAARGALADAVRTADALVLVVDAAAGPDEVDATFRSFVQFLGSLEEGRTHGREVGGLPVFLTLAKCDKLYRVGDAPTDWLTRIEDREREVQERFEEYLGDAVAANADSPYLEFGSVDLRLAATATEMPQSPAFAAYADDDKTFRIADLVSEVLPAARIHRLRVLKTRQRLRLTLTGIGGLVGVMLIGIVALFAASFGLADPLTGRVRAYQAREGPPAIRLAERNFTKNRKELTAIREAPTFDRLPADLQTFVEDRLKEFDAYASYRAKFQPPRLGPPDVRTQEELAALESALTEELAPPTEYADAWSETEAVRLRAKWRKDAALLHEAEARLHDWYRGLIRQAHQLLLIDRPPDTGWRGKVEALMVDANAPPFHGRDPINASPNEPIRRGEPLTYAPAFEFDRILVSQQDWIDSRDRLQALRTLTDALGLTAAHGPLAVPNRSATVDSVNASDHLRELRAAFPGQPIDHPEWSVSNFADPVRRWLAEQLRGEFNTAATHVRPLLLKQLGEDTLENWRRLADVLDNEPRFREWGQFLGLLRRWADPSAPADDPIKELAVFLRQDKFPIAVKSLELSIPDDVLIDRLIPAGKLVVKHTPPEKPTVEYTLTTKGDGRSDRPNTIYTFVPDGPVAFEYRPGDSLTAALPLRVGGQDYRLVWKSPRSSVYQFDLFARPPVLEKVGPIPAPMMADGVRVTFLPERGWPTVPTLFPVRP